MDEVLVEKAEVAVAPKGGWAFRRLCLLVFGILLVASAVAVRAPVMSNSVRLILVVTFLFGCFTGLLYLIRVFSEHSRLLYPAFFFLAFLAVWAVLGSRPPEEAMLRQRYCSRLRSFEGVRYVWGGETSRGIDCSGLARTALWQAMLHEGIKEANPHLLGPVLWKFWWRDMSARDILQGKYGYTHAIGEAEQVAGYDTSRLNPGDMAVTSDGVHVLIYSGKGQWIDAAPDDAEVTISKAPANSKRGWYRVPVTFVRWRILEEAR